MYNKNSRLHLDGRNIKVLMYHRVSVDKKRRPDYAWSITQAQLSRHLELLQRWGYTCISFEDHSLSLKGDLMLPKKPVILTFDDGYEEVYKFAMPVLKEFGVRATIFVLGDRSKKTNLWDSPSETTGVSLLDDSMIRDMHRSGFEIGSHSLTHANLMKLSGDDAWKEIALSKTALEHVIGAPVISFAYPFGATNPELKRMVEAAGYNYGCGSYGGPPRFSTDLFNIRRAPITRSTNSVEFAFKMLTPYSHYRWLLWKTHGRITKGKSRTEPMENMSKVSNAHKAQNAKT